MVRSRRIMPDQRRELQWQTSGWARQREARASGARRTRLMVARQPEGSQARRSSSACMRATGSNGVGRWQRAQPWRPGTGRRLAGGGRAARGRNWRGGSSPVREQGEGKEMGNRRGASLDGACRQPRGRRGRQGSLWREDGRAPGRGEVGQKSTQEEESERRKRRGWRRWWERPNEEGSAQERVSLGPRVSSGRWAWGRPSREEGSAGLAGLGSSSPLFLL